MTSKLPSTVLPGGMPVPGLRWPLVLPVAFCLVLATGCAGEAEELSQWIEQQKREVKPGVPPMAAPKPFVPNAYVGSQAVDPFSAQKLSVAVKQESRQLNAILASESNRRKEPLESFPLDGMNMVGSVDKQGRRFALLRVDKLIYQVKVGDYLGQNFGRITKIDETQIVLREIVQDAAGEWIERPASLRLQEQAR
jgi:type IV pilus assembly protein PilP